MLSDGPTPDEEAATARHFEYLKGLNEKGTALLAGRTQNTDESSIGVVILEVDSEDAARAVQEADPAVTRGIMRAKLFPYRAALMPEESTSPVWTRSDFEPSSQGATYEFTVTIS